MSTPLTTTPEAGADHQTIAATSNLRFMGCSFRESGGGTATAEFAIRHGTGTGDPVLFRTTVLANEADFFTPAGDGLNAPNGIYFDLISGAVEVEVYSKVGT